MPSHLTRISDSGHAGRALRSGRSGRCIAVSSSSSLVLLLLVLLLLVHAGSGCAPQAQGTGDGLSSCFCSLDIKGSELLIPCGEVRCVQGRRILCTERHTVDDGPCRDDGDLGGGGNGDGEGDGDGGSVEDGGTCEPGGGHCERNTFVPCEPGLGPIPCRAQTCVPSGEGPVAGCLSRLGYPCDLYHCVPGLRCNQQQVCEEPAECPDGCLVEGQRGCKDLRTPRECRQDGSGCLSWVSLGPCEADQMCWEGACEAYCDVDDRGCGNGERCESRFEGCVSDGTGFSPPLGYCAGSADCAVNGSVCVAAACMPHCTTDEDCLLLGTGGCCSDAAHYGVCRLPGQGGCG